MPSSAPTRASPTASTWARSVSNVIVTHTFSKLHGLAALRIGWGYVPIEAARPMVSGIPTAVQTPRSPARRRRSRRSTTRCSRRSRLALGRTLAALASPSRSAAWAWRFAPSGANFILVRFPTGRPTAPEAYDFLAERGYIVRAVANYGLPDCLRIIHRLEAHNRAVIDLLAEFLERSPR